MEKEPSHSKRHQNPLQDHDLERDEVREVLEFLRKNGTSILLALAIGIVASIGVIFYRNSQIQRDESAFAALSAADTPEALIAVAEDFSGTSAEQIARLEYANTLYRDGEYAKAIDAYQSFIDKFPEHTMGVAAKLSILISQEAAGHLEEALTAAGDFISANPDHFLLPQAHFARARCLAGLGRLQDAKNIYEEFIVANPDSEWTPQAESELMTIDRRIRSKASRVAE